MQECENYFQMCSVDQKLGIVSYQILSLLMHLGVIMYFQNYNKV